MIKRLWTWPRRTTTGDDVSKTRQAQTNLDQQQAAGTHNPATQCACGTWRTPGITHTTGDTGPTPSHKIDWCTK